MGKKIFIIVVVSLLFYGVSLAGQTGITKSIDKTNNTNVYDDSFKFLFVLPDNVRVEIIGDAPLPVPYTEGKYIKIKVIEGEYKNRFGVVGKDNIQKDKK